jgi:class 3 adenylate cyclase
MCAVDPRFPAARTKPDGHPEEEELSEERAERRLAAILAADVAGYSRLMESDEEGTLAALKAIGRELGDPKIAQHRGRIVKTTGDGMLVEFASVVDAVRCAAAVERAMVDRNAEICEDRRIQFRIGGQTLPRRRDEPSGRRQRAAHVFYVPQGTVESTRTTNTIERFHEEFRRRVKTQGSLPGEDAALILLFSLVASGQIKLRRIDGWRKIAAVLSQNTVVAA